MKTRILITSLLIALLGVTTQIFAKKVKAQAICKCIGDRQCGGSKIHKFEFKTQADCKRAQKDADRLCNSKRAELCHDKKIDKRQYRCRFRHTDNRCPI